MSEHNVIRFDGSQRDGSARRGAPDKAQNPERELACPRCGLILFLDSNPRAEADEVLCARCAARITFTAQESFGS